MPFLIVVPNSTLGNWTRECAKWIPGLKCVTLPGDSESCEVVEEWELFRACRKSKRQLAANVVLATFQSAEKQASLLRQVQRWEVVIVDEGQRLKSGKGGLFRALNSLTVGHRIIMTGTPLNNNLRELFNLLSFLDPRKYTPDLVEELEHRYSNLTPELIDELRTMIRPYMLRRTKEAVLDLPTLTEIIVPITMRPLQKQVYRGLLSKNANIITSIYSKGSSKKKSTRAGFQNLLMQLRKALAHPYLYDPEIEPSNVSSAQVHDNLVEASAKLVFLQKFVRKLLARGHRILMFSQFTIFLNILERFFDGEKLNYLRLDGTTSQLDRQTRIDHFNRKDSTCNIFLLSTKAGGAGINLATADVVIILDQDWNPHNDLQAISRAHRFGQKKPVSVFKLMIKGSAEEKIVQTGKRKLVLDHLVIQKVSEEEIEAHDVASILQYGAQELLTESDEAVKKDVRYTDEELDDLIQRTAEEAKPKESPSGHQNKPDKSFAFARVWEGRDKDLATVEAVEDESSARNLQDQRTFWDNILQANEAEQAKAQQEETGTGRGHRKRKEVHYNMPSQDLNVNLPNKKSRVASHSSGEDDDVYDPTSVKERETDTDESEAEVEALSDLVDLTGPPPTDSQLVQNHAIEDSIKAARRKQKLEQKYGILAAGSTASGYPPHPSNGAAGSSETPRPTLPHQAICDDPTQTSHLDRSSSNPYGTIHRPKVSRVALIEIPDLQGLPNDERRRKMDLILRDLIAKARALKHPQLDHLVSSIRTQDQAQQTFCLMEAYKLVKELSAKARMHHAAMLGRQHPFLSCPTDSSQASRTASRPHQVQSSYQTTPSHHALHPSLVPHNNIANRWSPHQPPVTYDLTRQYTTSHSSQTQARSHHMHPHQYPPQNYQIPTPTHQYPRQNYQHPPRNHPYAAAPAAPNQSYPSGTRPVVQSSSATGIPPVAQSSTPGHLGPVISQLPPPKFSQTNPKSIKPMLVQHNPSLYQPFSRSSSSSKHNRESEPRK